MQQAIRIFIIVSILLIPLILFYQNCGSDLRFKRMRLSSDLDKALIEFQAEKLELTPGAFESPTVLLPKDSDLKIPVFQYEELAKKGNPKTTSKTATGGSSIWPAGVIPVQFASDLPSGLRQAFIASAQEWAKVAGVKFVLKKGKESFLYVKPVTRASYSTLGYLPKGAEMGINLGATGPVLLHELGHTLGLIHEHSRSDRGECINVNPALSKDLNYKIFRSDNSIPYELDSIMHYEQMKVSNTGFNFDVLKACPYPKPVIGGKDISKGDAQAVAKLYPGGPGSVSLDAPALGDNEILDFQITDVKIPDPADGLVMVNHTFEIQWDIKNTGSKSWNSDYAFELYSFDREVKFPNGNRQAFSSGLPPNALTSLKFKVDAPSKSRIVEIFGMMSKSGKYFPGAAVSHSLFVGEDGSPVQVLVMSNTPMPYVMGPNEPNPVPVKLRVTNLSSQNLDRGDHFISYSFIINEVGADNSRPKTLKVPLSVRARETAMIQLNLTHEDLGTGVFDFDESSPESLPSAVILNSVVVKALEGEKVISPSPDLMLKFQKPFNLNNNCASDRSVSCSQSGNQVTARCSGGGSSFHVGTTLRQNEDGPRLANVSGCPNSITRSVPASIPPGNYSVWVLVFRGDTCSHNDCPLTVGGDTSTSTSTTNGNECTCVEDANDVCSDTKVMNSCGQRSGCGWGRRECGEQPCEQINPHLRDGGCPGICNLQFSRCIEEENGRCHHCPPL